MKMKLQEDFDSIYRRALSLGLVDEQIVCLDSFKQCAKKQSGGDVRRLEWFGTRAVLAGLLLSIIILSFTFQLHTSHGFTNLWLSGLDEWEVEKEVCTVSLPSTVVDQFRPPVDCGVCDGVDGVDRVSKLSPEQFLEHYAYSGRPLVVMDGASNWTAPDTFSYDFFRDVYAEEDVLAGQEDKCQFFPYKTEFQSLAEAFNMSEQRLEEPWYFGWSNCDPVAASRLRKHYHRPYFLPPDSESSRTDWIFMGTPGFGAHMHVDNVGRPSWQAQIRGKKRWTLEPPPECYFTCSGPIDVVIHPGEIIVLDTDKWYHKTLVEGEEVSIVIGSEYD